MFRTEETKLERFAHLSPEERETLLKAGAIVAVPYTTAMATVLGIPYPVRLFKYVKANGRAFARERLSGNTRELEYLCIHTA